MSNAALTWARAQRPDTPLTPTQRIVLMILADVADDAGRCWPSHAALADELGCAVNAKGEARTVARALKALKDAGLVAWEDRPGHQSNLYRLALNGAAAPSPVTGLAPSSESPAPSPKTGPEPVAPSSESLPPRHMTPPAPSPKTGPKNPQEPSTEPTTAGGSALAPPPLGGSDLRKAADEVMRRFVDWRDGQGQPIPREVARRLRTAVSDALGVGVDPELVAGGLWDWHERGRGPGSVMAFIEARGRGRPPESFAAPNGNGHKPGFADRVTRAHQRARERDDAEAAARVAPPPTPLALPSPRSIP